MPDKPVIFGQRKPAPRVGGSPSLRDHSRAYRKLCQHLLAIEPLCRYCFARGRVVSARVIDHIVALSLGGTNDPSNLSPACTDCNSAKALDERRFIARGHALADVALDPALREWFALARSGPSS